MLTNAILKVLLECKSFNEWFKKAKEAGIEGNEISQLWMKFKWQVSEDDKELIKQINATGNQNREVGS